MVPRKITLYSIHAHPTKSRLFINIELPLKNHLSVEIRSDKRNRSDNKLNLASTLPFYFLPLRSPHSERKVLEKCYRIFWLPFILFKNIWRVPVLVYIPFFFLCSFLFIYAPTTVGYQDIMRENFINWRWRIFPPYFCLTRTCGMHEHDVGYFLNGRFWPSGIRFRYLN